MPFNLMLMILEHNAYLQVNDRTLSKKGMYFLLKGKGKTDHFQHGTFYETGDRRCRQRRFHFFFRG